MSDICLSPFLPSNFMIGHLFDLQIRKSHLYSRTGSTKMDKINFSQIEKNSIHKLNILQFFFCFFEGVFFGVFFNLCILLQKHFERIFFQKRHVLVCREIWVNYGKLMLKTSIFNPYGGGAGQVLRTVTLQNRLPSGSFPKYYNLKFFKSKVNPYLSYICTSSPSLFTLRVLQNETLP